ncbi:metallophosphoesterase [Demequina sp. SYSU T00039]|uniref:Metallophosphoesterase n=1 Tax=Demequina lignilytica TaxID=3051663 RepID=A0AAW7M4C6_9MICO|nr:MULTISPECIES: metallophosphoesterase [unclassified Demequina]MDN4478644.1 metallophosphoesterase [Demequina sp. SYSU T00039-1]MDN4488622.1 metallophosphoesterase [Demequina sp. SYSU T00039]
MKVALLGDTHGNEAWIHYALEVFADAGLDTIIQVGDLGVWPGTEASRKWNRIQTTLEEHGQTMYVAPGNHEDYDQVSRLKRRDDGWLLFRDRILLAPRGHRTEMGGRTLVWTGGAASVDRAYRHYRQTITGMRTWWPQEEISDADVQATTSGGHADIMVTHDAPNGVPSIAARIAGNPGFTLSDLLYADEVRARLTEAFKAVQPALLLHGHYHFSVDEQVAFDGFSTRVFGLAGDEDPMSLGVLDLESLTPTFLPPPTAL